MHLGTCRSSLLCVTLLVWMSVPAHGLAASRAFYEPMQFSGPSRSMLFRVPVGESITLRAGTGTTAHPVLHGGDTPYLRCTALPATETGLAQWSCRALRTGSERLQVYFTIGERKSRMLTIIVDPPEDNRLPLPPRATFPDPVLADIATFRNPFPDTVLWSPAGKAAAELWRRGVLHGLPPDGLMNGSLPVNRAEAAKMLLNLRNIDATGTGGSIDFPDVPEHQWFTPFVRTAAREGMIVGYQDGTFRPGGIVTTAELLAMMARAFDLPTDIPHSFTDVPENSWITPFAGVAQQYDLFADRTMHLLPHQPLTREEVAVALYRYLEAR